MFKDDYRKEIDSISASEKFKKDTISLMKERQSELQQNTAEEKAIKFNPKPYRKIAATFAVMALALGVFAYSQSDFAISADQAETENTSKAVETADKDSKYDALPIEIGNEKMMRVYTINDAVEMGEIPESENEKAKIIFNTESSGGMGFEGLMYYDISQMNTKNPFNENIVLDTLPVYSFSPMSNEDIENEFNRILDFSDMDENNILSVSYEWVEFGWLDEKKVIMNTIRTDSAHKPSDDAHLYNLKIKLTDGNITIWPQRSMIITSLYEDVPHDIPFDEYIAQKASLLFNTSRDSFAYGDYDFNGNIMNIPYYVFKTEGNYAEKAFNHSAGNIPVWYAEEEQLLKLQYNASCAYKEATQLSAISWQQALDMLYNGDYISTLYEPIKEETAISKIELVYKAPPYYPPADYQSGYALPFYKFYVELPSFSHVTDQGTLKTYGVYYVCAIHPDLVEYTDGYLNYN